MIAPAHVKGLIVAACAVLAAAAPLAGGVAVAQKAAKGQDSPTVSGVTVTSKIAPVPNVGAGAPMFTPEELEAEKTKARRDSSDAAGAARLCNPGPRSFRLNIASLYRDEQAAQTAVMTAADRAREATMAATAVRVKAGGGEATQDEVNAAELARQTAVRQLLKKRSELAEARARTSDMQQAMLYARRTYTIPEGETMPQELINEEYMLRNAMRAPVGDLGIIVPRDMSDLILAEVKAVEREDGKRMMVSGKISNPRPKPVEVPALSFTAVDEFNIALKTEITYSRRAPKIAAGAAVPFAYEFNPMPSKAKTVVVAISTGEKPPEHLPVGMFCAPSTEMTEPPPSAMP